MKKWDVIGHSTYPDRDEVPMKLKIVIGHYISPLIKIGERIGCYRFLFVISM